jgi:hypothetical protein
MAGCHFKSIQRDFNIPEFTPDAWAAIGNQDWRSDVGLIDQRNRPASRPSKFDLALQNHKKDGSDQLGTCKLIWKSWILVLPQKRTLTQIVAIPATLYFPTSIVAELNEICERLGYTPEQRATCH